MRELELKKTDFELDSEMDQLVVLQNEVYKERGLVFENKLYEHWYLKNPVGRVISYNAFDGDKMVAHYACIPKVMNIDGRDVLGLLSMATVTHPLYRGRGLFTQLAQMTYDYASNNGFEYVIGVANANSFRGFIKHLGFNFIAQLQLKIGYNMTVHPSGREIMYGCYDKDFMEWRSGCGHNNYNKTQNAIVGTFGAFVRTYMGTFETSLLASSTLNKSSFSIKPMLYIGLGGEISGFYIDMPKFIKHSPFNLIFKDLTDGKLPEVNKDNVFFQLWDYDVA